MYDDNMYNENENVNETVNENVNENENVSENPFTGLNQDVYTPSQQAQDLNSQTPKEKKKKEKKAKKEKNPKSIGHTILHGMVFGLSAAVVFFFFAAVMNETVYKNKKAVAQSNVAQEQQEAPEVDKPIPNTEIGSDAQTISKGSNTAGELSIAQIVQNTQPSVVSITTLGVQEVRSMFGTREYESEGAGSGIVIGQNETELLVATNNHVVSHAKEVSVCFDEKNEDAVIPAKVKGGDAANDLAIVAVMLEDIPDNVKSGIRVASIGDSEKVQVGEQVVAIGNALGQGQSVTTGIISAVDREVAIEQYTAHLLQTDAAINPGNSGGALLNMRGELIGINAAKLASEEVEGMGYAIPIAIAKPILDDLMNRQTRELVAEDEKGFLGVSCQDVSQEAANFYGIPSGAYIGEAISGGAAKKAGIQKGDVIVKFDGLTISSSTQLVNTLAYYKAGETVDVVYMRSNNGEYEEHTVSVTLKKQDNKNSSKAEAEEEDEKVEEESEAEGETDQYYDDEQRGSDDFFGGDDFFGDFFRHFYGYEEDDMQDSDSKDKKGV